MKSLGKTIMHETNHNIKTYLEPKLQLNHIYLNRTLSKLNRVVFGVNFCFLNFSIKLKKIQNLSHLS